jgi:hypothetical protein
MRPLFFALAMLGLLSACQPAGTQSEFLEASWGKDDLQPLLEKTMPVHLDPSLDVLTPGEREAVEKLLEAGPILHDLYLMSRHHEALAAREQLRQLHEQGADRERTGALLDVYRMMRGPIVTTFDNRRVPFLPVAEEVDGKNVYPVGMTREAMDAELAAHAERRDQLLHVRTVVREATTAHAEQDLATLDGNAILDEIHPGLRERLESVREDPSVWGVYAVPYSVAYAEQILQVRTLLDEAADALTTDDPAFSHYLRLRARDLLADDYVSSDSAWVTGRFKGNLNAEIGSYETYDDGLYGVKSFFGLSLLLRDRERSDQMAAGIAGIQAIENALPYDHHRQVRENIPVGVYSIIADFGQPRGTNTATILPNESHQSRLYGRTILIRANILMNPKIFENALNDFKAATVPAHHGDLSPEGNLNYTLWHEIGHYLGVDRAADGRELDDALEDTADTFEELKADLVSLFSARMLHDRGVFDDEDLRAVYARGVDRVLLKNRPRRTQAYGTMQLMQWNWYLDRGLLLFDPESGLLTIDYERYPETVEGLLREVLRIQRAGDRDAADEFIERWTAWSEDLHAVTAGKMKAAERYRYSLVTYGVLGERPHSALVSD